MQITPPIALTIAGSDSSAGAGIQADLKTFQHFGVHGLSALTCIVAETPLEVRSIEEISISGLQDQLKILLETYPVGAIKIGLLPSRSCAIAVEEILKNTTAPIVIDPVMISSTGTPLMDQEAATSYIERLLPRATVITPNIPEAEFILSEKITTKKDLEAAAEKISQKLQTSCLIKGGHLANQTELLDILWHQQQAHHFSHPATPLADQAKGLHGTGCTLSSAIAAGLAKKTPLETATQDAIELVQKLIKNAHSWQLGEQAVQGLGWHAH